MRERRIKEASAVLAITDDQVLVDELRKSLTTYGRDLRTVPTAVRAYQHLQADSFSSLIVDCLSR